MFLKYNCFPHYRWLASAVVASATRKPVNYIYIRITISLAEQIRHYMMLYVFLLFSLEKVILNVFFLRFHSSFADAMNAAPLINYFLIYDIQFYYMHVCPYWMEIIAYTLRYILLHSSLWWTVESLSSRTMRLFIISTLFSFWCCNRKAWSDV